MIVDYNVAYEFIYLRVVNVYSFKVYPTFIGFVKVCVDIFVITN